MRYGISVPIFGDYADVRRLVSLAREAERAGWDGVFLWDELRFMGDLSAPTVDPWIALASIALSTSRIRFGCMVTPLARRRPWKVARETATLDQLSSGRLIVGVGLGYPQESEFEAFGELADPTVRGKILDEALAVLVGLWSGEPFTYAGEHFRVQDVQFLPRPVQVPRIPIWVGGYWPNRAPFRRASRYDGVFPGRLTVARVRSWTPQMITTEELRAIVSYIQSLRGDMTSFDVVFPGYTCGAGSADREIVDVYRNAGATWWIETLHGMRGPFAEMATRISAGPPK